MFCKKIVTPLPCQNVCNEQDFLTNHPSFVHQLSHSLEIIMGELYTWIPSITVMDTNFELGWRFFFVRPQKDVNVKKIFNRDGKKVSPNMDLSRKREPAIKSVIDPFGLVNRLAPLVELNILIRFVDLCIELFLRSNCICDEICVENKQMSRKQ